MFDSINHTTRTAVAPVTRVIEKGITPDKVTDMYNDVQKEVEANIIRKIVIGDNSVKGAVTEVKDPRRLIRIFTFRFTINSKEYIEEIEECIDETKTEEELINILCELLAERISKNLINKQIK